MTNAHKIHHVRGAIELEQSRHQAAIKELAESIRANETDRDFVRAAAGKAEQLVYRTAAETVMTRFIRIIDKEIEEQATLDAALAKVHQQFQRDTSSALVHVGSRSTSWVANATDEAQLRAISELYAIFENVCGTPVLPTAV